MLGGEPGREDIGRRAVLHDRPAVHHRDVVGEPRDRSDVVTDQQRGDAELRFELGQQPHDFGLDRGVQPSGGLVRDEEGRLGRERHRDHRPLTHAARQPVGMVFEPQARRIDLDPLEPVERPLLRFPRAFRPRVQANGLGDLVPDASEGIERRLRALEDHGDFLPPHRRHDALDGFPPAGLVLGHLHDPAVAFLQADVLFEILEQVVLGPVHSESDRAADHARAGADQARDRERGDALAAAALAHHAEGLAPGDRQRHAIHRANERLLAPGVEVGAQVLDLEQRRSHFPPLSSRMLFSPSPNRWKPRMVNRMASAGAVDGQNLP